MLEVFANNAITTLATSVSSSATSITLATGTGALFPTVTAGAQFFRLTLTSASTSATEITFCTARSGDVLTVQRAQESTTALTFSAGDIAANEITAGMMINVGYSPSADQANAVRYAVDTGTANNYAIALNPTMPTSVLGDFVMFKALNANTGASSLTINSGTSYALISKSGSSLVGGEIQSGSVVGAVFNGSSYTIVYSTGEALEAFNNIITGNLSASGTVSFLTPSISDNTTKGATTAFVTSKVNAILNSPAFTGTPTAPTASTGDNTTKLATTAFVTAMLNTIYNSPAFTGTPTAPTAATNTATSQLATTLFVQQASFGVGQSWQDLTSSRAIGTNYTNSTGKIINVGVTFMNSPNAARTSTAKVNGVVVDQCGSSYGGQGSGLNFSVPNGATYVVNSNDTYITWAELR